MNKEYLDLIYENEGEEEVKMQYFLRMNGLTLKKHGNCKLKEG